MTTSLLANGEVPTSPTGVGKPHALRGSVRKRREGAWGGWRRNGQEGRIHESGRPVRDKDGVHVHRGPKSRRTGVRASIGARKRRNGRGAKGRRKVDS